MKHLIPVMIMLTCSLVYAGENPWQTEAAIAKRDVWHAAKLRGVSFRALGQEPPWLLEITDGEKIVLATGYENKTTTYPYVEPTVEREQRSTIFLTKDRELEVVIEGKDCTDIMSGEKFAVSVTITLHGKQLSGCGRALH